jgi:sigma-B regulation protein RsbU (phosphoserine phosphatase)
VLGLFETVVYDGGRVEMRPGDTLVVYSDGVTETWDPDGEEFGEESLIPLVVRNRAIGAEALQNVILREIERFEAGARATDDRTIVVLRRE